VPREDFSKGKLFDISWKKREGVSKVPTINIYLSLGKIPPKKGVFYGV